MMHINIKRLHPEAVLPQLAHVTDAGADLTAVSKAYNDRGDVVYGTGLAMEIPMGFVGLLFPRSSICKTDLHLTNCVGVIDSGYRGEVKAVFRRDRLWDDRSLYDIGDRICQLIVIPIPSVQYHWATELEDSDRGEGGYGSTGK